MDSGMWIAIATGVVVLISLGATVGKMAFAQTVKVQVVQSTPPDPNVTQLAMRGWQGAQIAPLHKITCRFCNTLFLLQTGRYECPNCGAPAQG